MTDSSSKKISVAGVAEMGSIKTVNEDAYESYTCGPHKIYLIASGSGIGTSGKGKVALDMVLSALGKFFKERESSPITHEEIVGCIRDVNREVFERSLEEPKYAGMAVSLSMALITEERVYVVHVGNTRMYMLSGPRIEQLTKDHTLAEELKRTGAVGSTTPSSPMSQVLTRAIGKAPHIEPDVFSFALADLNDNRLFACSKGLYNRLEDHELLEELLDGAPEAALAKTIKRAKEKSPSDNLAIVVIDPNGYKGESSSASSDSSEDKTKSTQDVTASTTAKDGVTVSDKIAEPSAPKADDKNDLLGKPSGSKENQGTEGSKALPSSESSSRTSPSSSPSPWSSSPFSSSSSTSGGGLSSSPRPGMSYPSSPLSALVAPSVESTGARAGIDSGATTEAAGAQPTPQAGGLGAPSLGAGASGAGQPPAGFEQESSGHLKPRGAGFGAEGASSGGLRGIGGGAGQEGGGDAAGFSSRKTSTSLESTVAGRGEPKFEEDESSSDLNDYPLPSPRSALSKLGRAILVGVVGGTVMGRVFNSDPTEPVKPAGDAQQQVAEVSQKGGARKLGVFKSVGEGAIEKLPEQSRKGELTEISPVTDGTSEGGPEASGDVGGARLNVKVDSRKSPVAPSLDGGDSVDSQEATTGLERALGRRSVADARQVDRGSEATPGVMSPEQSMRARAGMANLNRGEAVGALKGTGELEVAGSRARGPGVARSAAPGVSAPQVTAAEVLNKFPQLTKISDPDLRLMLTDVLTAFEETSMLSKQELVGVEAERQRLNARLEVLERHISKNMANKVGADESSEKSSAEPATPPVATDAKKGTLDEAGLSESAPQDQAVSGPGQASKP